MNSNLDLEETRIVAEQAAAWRIALESNDPQQVAAFWTWIKKSPLHVREALAAGVLDMPLRQVEGRHLDLKTLLASARDNVIALNGERVPVRTRTVHVRKFPWFGLAAGLLLVLLGTALWWGVRGSARDGRDYTTEAGELRVIPLADGSSVSLDTRSHLKVRFSVHGRDVDLSGQALFRVAHDALRPFRVHIGATTVEAVGTEFNVRADADHTTIAVLEGVVRVASRTDVQQTGASPGGQTAQIAAGQAALVSAAGQVRANLILDRAEVTAWQERRLVFKSTPLVRIAQEFNRYVAKPIRVEGQALGERSFGGVFDATDPSPLLKFVAASDPSIVVERHENEVVIRQRAAPAPPE